MVMAIVGDMVIMPLIDGNRFFGFQRMIDKVKDD
jgi:hypothetical protein